MDDKSGIDENGAVTRDAIVQGYKWVCIAPGYMGGHPALFGMRTSVQLILDFLSQGMSVEEVAEDYALPLEAVREAVQFAQEAVSTRKVV